jgi:hypothetical protein
MLLLVSAIVLTACLIYLLNKKFPVDGPFEVTNLIGRIIAVSILVVAAIMALERMFE